MTEDRFGFRLRQERERRRITLESIAVTTKISVSLLKGLERDDVSKWPAGIFRRAFIRSYAQAIGLDPDETAREFFEHFPDPAAFVIGGVAGKESRPKDGHEPRPRDHAAVALRLTLDDAGEPFLAGRLLARTGDRLKATAWDGGCLTIIGAMCFATFGDFWLPFIGAMLCYYMGSILLLGNTPGVCLFAPGHSPHGRGPFGARDEREEQAFAPGHPFSAPSAESSPR